MAMPKALYVSPPTPPPGFKLVQQSDLQTLYQHLTTRPSLVLVQIRYDEEGKKQEGPYRHATEFVVSVSGVKSDKTGQYIAGTGGGKHSGKEVHLRIAPDYSVELRMPHDHHDSEWYEPEKPAKAYVFISA